MGLEYVSIELDNPFGIDDNDFDNLGMAYVSMQQKGLSPPVLHNPCTLCLAACILTLTPTCVFVNRLHLKIPI